MKRKDTTHRFLEDNQISCRDEHYFSMALIHPSYAQENKTRHSNQRLEFLGDAVLNFVTADYLYTHYPNKAEGDLTKIRARVVCENALVDVAAQIDLGSYLLLGRGEEKSGGRQRKSILADAVEAVIGAIYLDQGMPSARDFILKHLQETIHQTAEGEFRDFKSRLQEIVQARGSHNVYYETLEESGPLHAKVFEVGVYYESHLLARGTGSTKKEAEQHAAEKVLQDMHLLNQFL
ncbi:MAG TPA: ribonuclease III [Syntrophomonas sp.]|nr:ribonuclease III [Syntrophomonas sp.]HRW11754.1 ribonuclease III [Syntrophomonas sp.]